MSDIVKRLLAPISPNDDYFIAQWPNEEPVTHDAIRFHAADEIKRLRAANRILRLGLNGLVDSSDAAEIADAIAAGEAIDWDRYPPATRAALEEKA